MDGTASGAGGAEEGGGGLHRCWWLRMRPPRAERVTCGPPRGKHAAGRGRSEATGHFPEGHVKAGRGELRSGLWARTREKQAERVRRLRSQRRSVQPGGNPEMPEAGWAPPPSPPVGRAEHSPELIHHPHQHEERVLADPLLECVSERRELLVRGGRVKETTMLTRAGCVASSGGCPLPATAYWCRRCAREPGARPRRPGARAREGTGLVQAAGLQSGTRPRLLSATTLSCLQNCPHCTAQACLGRFNPRFPSDFLKRRGPPR